MQQLQLTIRLMDWIFLLCHFGSFFILFNCSPLYVAKSHAYFPNWCVLSKLSMFSVITDLILIFLFISFSIPTTIFYTTKLIPKSYNIISKILKHYHIILNLVNPLDRRLLGRQATGFKHGSICCDIITCRDYTIVGANSGGWSSCSSEVSIEGLNLLNDGILDAKSLSF